VEEGRLQLGDGPDETEVLLRCRGQTLSARIQRDAVELFGGEGEAEADVALELVQGVGDVVEEGLLRREGGRLPRRRGSPAGRRGGRTNQGADLPGPPGARAAREPADPPRGPVWSELSGTRPC
jgi:hypothetical protein